MATGTVNRSGGEIVRITPEIVENDNYTITYLYCYKNGRVVTVGCSIACTSPYTTSPGILCISHLPYPIYDIYTNVAARGSSGTAVRVYKSVSNTGLYLRYGLASTAYDLNLVYLTDG